MLKVENLNMLIKLKKIRHIKINCIYLTLWLKVKIKTNLYKNIHFKDNNSKEIKIHLLEKLIILKKHLKLKLI